MAETDEACRSDRRPRRLHQCWLRLFGYQAQGARTRRNRARALALVLSLIYLALGTLQVASRPALLQKSPFDLDLALRALALGWFDDARTWPVTLVAIDESTHRAWGSPAVTPRSELARLLGRVAAAGPLAVFVDIDLAGGQTAAGLREEEPLLRYLRGYAGEAPLVFPKRLEPGSEGRPVRTASHYDAIFAANPWLSWAHAALETDSRGTVREFSDWALACGPGPAEWLPFAPLALGALVRPGGATPPADAGGACASAAQPLERRHRLLVGPRLSTGDQAVGLQGTAFVVRAAALDDGARPLDPGLFAGRIVLVGATHRSTGDLWLTPAGVLPGVELLAQAVRFWPLQETAAGAPTGPAVRVGAVLLFLLFVLLDWYLRPVFAVLAAGSAALALAALGINVFGTYAVFDLIEAAVLLAALYKLLRLAWEFACGFLARRRRHGPDGRARATLQSLLLRDDVGDAEDD